jgi:putative ABC transport system permease protein
VWWPKRRSDRDFAQEIRSHVALEAERLIADGIAPHDAEAQARRAFGNITAAQERFYDSHRIVWLHDAWRDIAYAARTLTKSPGFAALALLTLAVGIGVNTAVFIVIDGLAFKPLPVEDARHVFRVERWLASGARGDVQYAFLPSEYARIRDGSRAIATVVAAAWPERKASTGRSLTVQQVSNNFFSDLGVRALTGRTFGNEADVGSLVVLSHRFWLQRFNGDPSAVGASIVVNDRVLTIAGVAPPEFIGLGNPPQVPDLWMPMTSQTLGTATRGAPLTPVQMVVRLHERNTPTQAATEVTPLVQRAEREAAPSTPDRTVAVTLEGATFFGGTHDPRVRVAIAGLMVLVGLVLLVACANVANMALARTAHRVREIAVRLSLGASRARIVRLLMAEAVLVATVGGMAALVAAIAMGRWLTTWVTQTAQLLFGPDASFVLNFDLNIRVIAFVTIISALAAGLVGLSPAAQCSRPDLTSALKDDEWGLFGQPITRSRLRTLLLAAEIAVSALLVAMAAFLTRGLVHSRAVDPGFDATRLFLVTYPGPHRASTVLRIADEVGRLSEVEATTLVRQVPLAGTWTPPIVLGEPGTRSTPTISRTLANDVSTSYFDALKIPILRGRVFSASEARARAAVAVVSESAARSFWPRIDPLGKTFALDMDFKGRLTTFTVIGIAGDVRTANLSRIDPAYVYIPTDDGADHFGSRSFGVISTPNAEQAPTGGSLLVRIRGNPGQARDAIQRAIGHIDSDLVPGVDVISVNDTFLRVQRILPIAFSTFALALAGIALIISTVGLYAMTSYLVIQRTREIGIRVALGARRWDVLRQVFGQGLTPILVGGCFGLGATLALGVLVRNTLAAPETPDFLFGVGVFDPRTFAGVYIALSAVAFTAMYFPARRAATVDPLVALRSE